MGQYEELKREQRQFLEKYLNNPEKPQWKCYAEVYGTNEETSHTSASRMLNKDHILQAIAELLGPTKTAIVVKMSKLGDRAVKELKDLITLKPVSKVEADDDEVILDNRRIKLKAIKTLLDRIGIEGSGDGINIAINNAPDQSEEQVDVDLDNLNEEQRENFLETSREIYIE